MIHCDPSGHFADNPNINISTFCCVNTLLCQPKKRCSFLFALICLENDVYILTQTPTSCSFWLICRWYTHWGHKRNKVNVLTQQERVSFQLACFISYAYVLFVTLTWCLFLHHSLFNTQIRNKKQQRCFWENTTLFLKWHSCLFFWLLCWKFLLFCANDNNITIKKKHNCYFLKRKRLEIDIDIFFKPQHCS